MLEGRRFSWRAWKPVQPRRVECAETNLRRFLTRLSSMRPDPGCFADEICDAVCWQIALCDDQCAFWQSGDCETRVRTSFARDVE